jgi:hypothetical protein
MCLISIIKNYQCLILKFIIMKNLFKIGKKLNKAQQKEVVGGRGILGPSISTPCNADGSCPPPVGGGAWLK